MENCKFSGEYSHSLDTKGRVIVPLRHREALGEQFFVTRGLDHCLYIYSKEDWYKTLEKLEQIQDMLNPQGRAFKRFLIGSCKDCEVDKQGRILIPQSLREYAHLEREAVLVGMGNRIEVWSKERWDAFNEELDIDAVAAGLKAEGINM